MQLIKLSPSDAMTIIRKLRGRFAHLGLGLSALTAASSLFAAGEPKITPPKDIIGFSIGDDYHMASYTQISTMEQKWATESDRLKVVSIGLTEEGRQQYMAIISSPANLAKLAEYKAMSQKLARAEMTEDEAHAMAKIARTVVWIDGGLHATETVNSQSLAEEIYQMISRTDEETMRFLNDNILLMPVPNPDGVEFVANWYMHNPDPLQRTLGGLPRLYHKYVGHDDNRDSITMNMKETTNQNRILFVEWNPQIMHNVHQTGPAGAVIFIPPFRDPFNYDFDPLVPIGIERVGTAMHERLIAKGMGGSAMRSAAPYSTWWDGGMRTATYFRNQIGILTEIIGGPTPAPIPLVAEKQLPTGDWPLPIKPQMWHYRQSIDYMVEVQRAVMDYASRNRENVLYNIYAMGRHSIDKGNQDSWTITPKRIAALNAAAKAAGFDPMAGGRGGRGGGGAGGARGGARGGRGAPGAPGAAPDAAVAAAPAAGDAGGGFGFFRGMPSELYDKVLHDPAFRDPRGYIISSDQDDFPTAVKFVNVMLKGGVEVQKATKDFEVAGKKYPAGSYVVKAAQAFRPAVLDLFEPQDHPTDLEYPGGPPKRPYDITGWTLAAQMNVKFDRVMDAFDGPFEKLGFDMQKPMPATIAGVAKPAGYLVSHKINDSFILINRLLKANADVYWLNEEKTVDGHALGTGTLWIPASDKANPIVARAAKELGIAAFAQAEKPAGEAMKLKPIRIGLVDVYGGSMPSGWLRWMLEQYEFSFELVFPQVIDAGNLKSSYDVILFPSGTYTEGRGGRGGGRGGAFGVAAESVPEEYRSMLGAVTATKSVPALKTFVEEGGTLLAIGSSASIGEAMGLPVKDHLVEAGPDGVPRHLSNDKFYIPGSVLRAKFNTKDPLAFGMPENGYVFFDDSPTFTRGESTTMQASKVAWFEGKDVLYSGWAIGQEYLDGGELATEAKVGAGHLVLIGLEATFRATPHGTFKLLFNGLYLGSASNVPSVGVNSAGTN
jgi:hypothetical protein